MHAVSLSLGRADDEEGMAFTPPVECPICRDVLELDRTLEDHLVGNHSHAEVARHLACSHEGTGTKPVSN
ncbi:hypothetical protein [Natrinema caseinilyticum]|uniref:hypothetical protein n=1 Tax=Natrinema caseinilyticum TaxID=2961570 RepID=UPI0020C4D734|nr:hypothetical protein [Natrinema caseinilyticum]